MNATPFAGPQHAAPAGDSLAHLQPFGRALLSVEGMWCPSCAAATAQVLQRIPGILSAQVSFATSSVLLKWDPQVVDLEQARGRVERLGYRLLPAASTEQTLARIDRQVTRLGIRLAVGVLFGMWTMLCSLLLYIGGPELTTPPTGTWLAIAAGIAAVPVYIVAGLPVILAGWRTLRTGVPGMDTLVSLGTLAAIALSMWQLAEGDTEVYFDTSVMLILLLTTGRLIETITLRHAARAIGALQDMLPESAERLEPDGRYRQVPARSIRVGDQIRISAGQRASLDGEVVSGHSAVDCSALTGESRPRKVAPGDALEAGSTNLTSALNVTVTAAVGQRHIDRIGVRMAEAAGRRGNTQRMADTLARFIVPVALALSATSLLVSWFMGVATPGAILRAVTVLIIACPCAVSIAVPIAYVAAASRSADNGILFRDPAAMEAMAGIDTMVLDKTGTLTHGRPRVTRVQFHESHPQIASRSSLLNLVAQAEEGITHPLADALREAARESPSNAETTADSLSPVNEQTTKRYDRGVRMIDTQLGEVLVGSQGFLREMGIHLLTAPEARPQEPAGSRVEVAVNGLWLATLFLADELRDDAADALKKLRHMGIHCSIASGDGREPVLDVARKLGLEEKDAHWECTPQGKADFVERLGAHRTGFAGDGINDGPALATANVGLAVSDATSTATAAANVVLAKGGVGAIPLAVQHARRAHSIMKQNLFFAVIYNLAGLSLAASGSISPVVAALAMAASSLSVIANASRLSLGQAYSQQPSPA